MSAFDPKWILDWPAARLAEGCFGASGLTGLVHHPNEGQLAILMCVVDATADDENVGYGETDEIGVNCHLAATRFVDKCTGKDTRCFLLADQVARMQKRAARVYDVVNKQHGAAGKVQLSLTDQAHVTRTLLPMAVAAKPDELDARSAANAIKRTDEICDKDKAAHQ